MAIQKTIGADIMMQLDDVVASTLKGERVVQAMHRLGRRGCEEVGGGEGRMGCEGMGW